MARPNDHLGDLVEVGRTVEVISYCDEWVTAIDAVLDGTLVYANSSAYDITSTTGAWVCIYIDSAGAPTNVRVLAQFSHNGTTWWDFEEGLWASMFWEDADTAAGIHKTYLLPCGGQDLLRFGTVATGTGQGAEFAVRVLFRPFRGAYGMAHA